MQQPLTAEDLVMGVTPEQLLQNPSGLPPAQPQGAPAPGALPPGGMPPPGGMVPPAAPMQQQGGIGGFLGSPGMAMAGSALQNLGEMTSYRQPRLDPIQAYQQTVNRQAVLAQRDRAQNMQQARDDRQAELHPLTVQAMEQKLDPGSSYKELVKSGLIDPTEMSYPEYMTMSGNNQLPASVREWQHYASLSPEEKSEYLTMKRSAQLVGGGGGTSMQIDPATGGARLVGQGPETIAALDANRQGAITTAEGGAKSDTEQFTTAIDTTWANRQAYDMAQKFKEVSANTLAMLDDPTRPVDTGPINAFLYNVFGVGTEELAAMNADAVRTVLENLKIANLAPVTEQELRTVAGLWADIGKQRAPNRGLLQRAMRESTALMDRLQADTKTQANRVRRYGGEDEYQNLIGTNPFVAKQFEETQKPGIPVYDPGTGDWK